MRSRDRWAVWNAIIGMGLAVLALLGLGCATEKSVAEQRLQIATEGTGEIVAAAVWPWAAHADILYREGLELALEEINAGGGPHGRTIRLRYEDDGGSVNEGRLTAQKLASDPEIMAVIGHLQSFVTVPAAAIYDLAGLVLIAPTATSVELTDKSYERVFRTTFTDAVVGEQMADYAVEQGYTRTAIYYIRNDYGRDLANAYEERLSSLGQSVVARDSYEHNVRPDALAPLFDRWQQMQLDAIFLAGEVPSAGNLITEFRKGGIEVPVFGGDALFNTSLIAVAGDRANGTVVPGVFHPDNPRPEVRQFVERFEAKFGKTPDAGAALAYDSLHLLAHGMSEAPSVASADLAATLHSLTGWRGVTGLLSFDAKGDLNAPRVLKAVVEDGAFRYLNEGFASTSTPQAGG